MKNTLFRNRIVILIGILLVLGLSSCSKDKEEPERERPPEYNELRAAMRIEDSDARIKEMEALKAKYPESQYVSTMESSILGAKIDLSTSVEAILALQKPSLESAEGLNKLYSHYSFSLDILDHDKLEQFDSKKVTQAVADYAQKGLMLSGDPEYLETITEKQLPRLKSYIPMLYLSSARAYLNEDDPEESSKALKSYLEIGGSKDKAFYYYQAQKY